jgi:catalase
VHCLWADEEYGVRMTEALGLDLARVRELAKGDQKTLIAATLH